MRNSAPGCRFGYGFDQYPGGFRAAAFHPEDALTGFHDWLCITVLGHFESAGDYDRQGRAAVPLRAGFGPRLRARERAAYRFALP